MLLLLQETLEYIEQQQKLLELSNVFTITSQIRYERIHYKITSCILTSLQQLCPERIVDSVKEEFSSPIFFENGVKNESLANEPIPWPSCEEYEQNMNPEARHMDKTAEKETDTESVDHFDEGKHTTQDHNITVSHKTKQRFMSRGCKCEICETEFKHKTNLRRHMFIHTGRKPFECTICDKSYFRKYLLTRHILIHTDEKPFECDICEKKFRWKSDLKRHLLVHKGERVECEICEKKFKKKSDLKRHLLAHVGDRPFECKMCKKKFKNKSNLRNHWLVHTEKRAFECKICKKKFKRNNALKRHLRNKSKATHVVTADSGSSNHVRAQELQSQWGNQCGDSTLFSSLLLPAARMQTNELHSCSLG